ncbi:MAG: WalW protein [Planctomycetota bacterium]
MEHLTVARLPADHPPILVPVLDAEEEFDWEGGFHRAHTAASAMTELPRGQAVFEAFGIRPTYVVTYPVAMQAEAAAPLRAILASGRACLGAHLHPWVTPPFDEQPAASAPPTAQAAGEISRRLSFPGNLPRALESAKLAATVQALEQAFGERPRIYQAGRYGLGPNSAAILREQGFLVDTSPLPTFDYRHEGGPDFSGASALPTWNEELLVLPQTAALLGWLAGGRAAAWHRRLTQPLPSALRLPGLLSRLRALERLRLSPEGYEHNDHRRLTRELLARGQRCFVFSFHTPSLKPGCTPYVRSVAERDALLERCRRYFDWFLGELRGIALTPLELRDKLLALRTP